MKRLARALSFVAAVLVCALIIADSLTAQAGLHLMQGVIRFGAVTAGNCVQWRDTSYVVDAGQPCVSGGSGAPCVTLANSFQYDNAGVFGCNAGAIATASGAAFWAKAIDEADFTGNFAGAADITSLAGTAGGSGNELAMQMGGGNGFGTGGDFLLRAGNGGASGGSGGPVNIYGGNGGAASTNNGGNIRLFGGNGYNAGTVNGATLHVDGGLSTNVGGTAYLTAGDGATGGAAYFQAGNSLTVAKGPTAQVSGGGGQTLGGDILLYAGSVVTGTVRGNVIVNAAKFLIQTDGNNQPTLGTCAAGTAVFGTDSNFHVTTTMGVTGTSCVINFGGTWANASSAAPNCTVTGQDVTVNMAVTAVSLTSLTIGMSAAYGNTKQIFVHCIGTN